MASVSFTFDAKDPMISTILRLLSTQVGANREELKPGPVGEIKSTPDLELEGPEELNARSLWARFRNGVGSKRFLKRVAEYCLDNGIETYTFDDIMPVPGYTKEQVKALNRNVARAQHAEGVKIITSTWDYSKSKMQFKISKAHCEAIISLALSDDAFP